MEGGEKIKRKEIIILFVFVCVFIISLNVSFANNNETGQIHTYPNNLNGSLGTNSISGKIIEITQKSYDDYFNRYTGEIKENAPIKNGDILKIGNISDRGFVIDRQLTLMPSDSNNQLSNVFIHLVKGSDGSVVTGLNINNTKAILNINSKEVGYLHGIWLSDTNNNTISYNTIRIADSGGVYAMPMHFSSNNRIIYNDMKTYVSSNIIMTESHFNFISRNTIEVLSYSDYSVTNLIYFSPFAFAGRMGSALCEGNTISYNKLIGYCTLPMSIIIQAVYSNHNNTIIANNTIYKGSYGINLESDNAQVYNNTVNGSAIGISVSGKNISVCDNVVFGTSQKAGIVVHGKEGSIGRVKGNKINFKDIEDAFVVGSYLDVYSNVVNVADYGNAISIVGNSSLVHNNNVKSSYDDAITFLGNRNVIDSNIINTNARGISITTSGLNRYYNNTISNNKITSDSYGIYLNGLVYYTSIFSNVIETNATLGIFKDITDEIADNSSDNMINGVIYDATALIIDDNNFYEYFDENGYLNYTFKENKTKTIFFTHLSNKNVFFTEKVNVVSNKQSNLLFNVLITFEGDASGSLIRDFNFMNYNKNAIILKDVSDVSISHNNITTIFNEKSGSDAAILVYGEGNDNIIVKNNIYVNSKSDYAYGISVSSYNQDNYMHNKEFSKGYKIIGNNIIMISKKMAEAIFSDAIVESDIIANKINIISDGCGYGIASVNVIGQPYAWNISGNEIIIHSKEMAYLIEIHMSNNMTIENNYLYSRSNASYGIATYMSNNISIINNDFDIFALNESIVGKVFDVMGVGNSAIFVGGFSNHTNITNNTIYSNSNKAINIGNSSSIINFGMNRYVISDINYRDYTIRPNDVILLDNLTLNQVLVFDIPVTISNFNSNIKSIVSLVFNANSSNSNIVDSSLINSTVTLNNVSNIGIVNSSFISSKINIIGGYGNYLINNTFKSFEDIIQLINTSYVLLNNNAFYVNSNNRAEVIFINNSQNISILNNNIAGIADLITLISSLNSNSTIIRGNLLDSYGNSSYGYYGVNSHFDEISLNNIKVVGICDANQSAIYYKEKSSNNNIFENMILSYSKMGDDYAITVISDENLNNCIVENYLISGNGSKRSNFAVNAKYDLVKDNTPHDIYVLVNGSDKTGDGTLSNPYASISFALKNALNHSVIHVGGGMYFESDLKIDKNITLSSFCGEAMIDAKHSQLFNITKNAILTINGFTLTNGHNCEGGALFINKGILNIHNSTLCNSSSYYDNSDPIFDNNVSEKYAYTVDCRDDGKGGAILNYGNLLIDNTLIYGNLAHIGGAIADYGKTTINSSVFYLNKGVHGGVIFTDSSKELRINNTLFYDNSAIRTFNYCMVKKSLSAWSISGNHTYSYTSECNLLVGVGGVIFTNNTDVYIDNSEFNKNSAWKGGAIASNYASASALFKSNVDLIIKNSSFINNRAQDTKVYDNSKLPETYIYGDGYDGGAIYGAFNKFNVLESDFMSNQVKHDGGALYVQSPNALIDLCNFIGNRAGVSGGALFVSNNFLITRTIISNNSAIYGGAINYDSYYYYGHVQNNLNIYNTTISDNMALNAGGAFRVGQANITVHYSNIYNNFAPEGTTVSSSYITSNPNIVLADMRYNYWGPVQQNGRPANADNSVYNFPNIKLGSRLKDKVVWILSPDNNNDEPSVPVNPGSDTNANVNPVNTNTNTATNSNIGGQSSGFVIGPNGASPNPGSNMGFGDGGDYNGPNVSGSSNTISNAIPTNIGIPTRNSLPSSDANPGMVRPDIPNYSPSNNQSNSLSRVNDSSFDDRLNTVGMTANAISSSSSSSSSYGESSSSQSSSSSSKSYELEKKSVKKEINNNNVALISIILAIVFLFLLIFGYKREENNEY